MKILVVELVGCNLAYLGCYGNEWVATPNLDRLAAEGIVFDQHFSGSPAARFEPATHRTIDAIDDLPDVAAELCEESTGVVWIAGPRLSPPWDPDACITDYAEDNERIPWFGPTNRLTLDDLPSVADTYAGAMTYFDAQLGNLLDAFEDSEWTIVVTASMGLAIEELALGGPGIGEESVHLPLIVRFADRRHAGERMSALTQPSDLVATLRSWLELPADSTLGRDLMPLVRGEIESLRPSVVSVQGESAALRTPEWALLRAAESASRLFVKPDDRWEVNDVAQHHREVVEALEAELAKREAGDTP
ncbi:MAG TPA: sulfatase-like hydrolase/transferase [Gemmataceae bacterium]|jgi:arylsulfatase A-like enzyme|nr:sulfatase-like hydrolase/transferase [Gemmataceae bacterium]